MNGAKGRLQERVSGGRRPPIRPPPAVAAAIRMASCCFESCRAIASLVRPADPEFARFISAAFHAHIKNNFTAGAVGLFFQLAILTIRFSDILIRFTRTARNFMMSGFFPECIIAYLTQGVETGPAFFFQRFAAPVQVCHSSVLTLDSRKQKTLRFFTLEKPGECSAKSGKIIGLSDSIHRPMIGHKPWDGANR